METLIFGQWWRSHQSLACKGLCIFRFCVMSWKGESEPNIKFCLGRKIELLQEFITIQNFGHNWWRANGIRVESFLKVHHIAALQQSPRVHDLIMSDPARIFKGRIIFMSMFNDILWRSEDNDRECDANADLVSIYTKRFPAGRWSFLGPGSEKKWCSTHESKPQG